MLSPLRHCRPEALHLWRAEVSWILANDLSIFSEFEWGKWSEVGAIDIAGAAAYRLAIRAAAAQDAFY